MYLIRNDITGRVWRAQSGEARMYAIGGALDTHHSVFHMRGVATPLITLDIV